MDIGARFHIGLNFKYIFLKGKKIKHRLSKCVLNTLLREEVSQSSEISFIKLKVSPRIANFFEVVSYFLVVSLNKLLKD